MSHAAAASSGESCKSPQAGLPGADVLLPDVLDAKHLAQLRSMQVPGKGTLFDELVIIFQRESPSKVENLCRAVASRDAALASRLAHAMVGSLATIGARQMQLSVRALELAAETGDWMQIEKTHSEVLAAWRSLQEALPLAAGKGAS